ncbi:MAG: 1-deoxy-D-xylulose-5-phosphate synthase [Clostridia bacterium]|nr:1-deoxy-D-xylulose-5-phosphate synthase [Clostridia bacterium]MDQ7790560.1 1-deoxy-D-xylulose-5-phosphate synthase [Clostridia bacterium]
MTEILERINTPRDLRPLSLDDMDTLAGEIRELIVQTVSQTGGHLAPSLGVVELCLALHRVFQAPNDRIIWDVGHQCYAHKIITGRRDQFGTLRQYEGLSGFPSRLESIYDIFGTGHSSTSISAAVGLAVARDIRGDERSVVAVIGDGAMTAGMAFEALNHAGHLRKRLVVVLNDNEMSIARNVGALSGYLSRLRTDPMYSRGKEEFETLMRRIPAIGPRVLKWGERVKDSLKYLVVPGMLFEELGFTYLGPVDGHNIAAMISVFNQAKTADGPVLVHVLTRKGKGYAPAEANPDKFHGVGPFEIDTGKTQKGPRVTYTEVFGRTVVRLAHDDERVVAITGAMTTGTGLVEFSSQYPDRFFDVGIAEQHAVTLAAGLAVEGMRPVVTIYSTFLQRAFDQVVHDVCLQNLPVVFALDRGGLVGDDGPTHQGAFDLSYLRMIPNIVVAAPKDENELQHLLKSAVDHSGPIAVRYPRGTGTGCPLDQELKSIPIGKGEVVKDGDDVTLLAIGNMVQVAVEAAETLATKGINAAVINARFIKPLDIDLITRYAKRTRIVITLEENTTSGGFGSAVLELLANKEIDEVRVRMIGIPDIFVEHGKPSILREKYGLTAATVVEVVENEKQRAPKLRLAVKQR